MKIGAKSPGQLDREIATAIGDAERRAGDQMERALRALRTAEATFEKRKAALRRSPHDVGPQRSWNKAYDALEKRQIEYETARAAWRASRT